MNEDTPVVLNICERLFSDFHEQEVVYCHWKSNEHLLEGLAGTTDLDIIVESREKVEKILHQNGFKRFGAVVVHSVFRSRRLPWIRRGDGPNRSYSSPLSTCNRKQTTQRLPSPMAEHSIQKTCPR